MKNKIFKYKDTMWFNVLIAFMITIVAFIAWESYEDVFEGHSVFNPKEQTELELRHTAFHTEIGIHDKNERLHYYYEEAFESSMFFIFALLSLFALTLKRKSKELKRQVLIVEENLEIKQQLHQAQRLESIGTLAGGIAHDFNNILMAMQGSISLLLLDIDPVNPCACSKELHSLEDNILSASQLTNRLLGFARGGKYDAKPYNMNSILKDASELFGRTSKDVEVFLKLQEDIWPVMCDRSQMDQVFMNMLINAGQAIYRDEGKIQIRTKNIDKGGVRFVEITISDSGVGITEDNLEYIFDPFFTTKEKDRGTGLGLSQVYGTIINHDGTIEVSSVVGTGTVFIILLPASDEEMYYEDVISVESTPDGVEGTILIIDDETMVSNMAQRMLERIGYDTMVENVGVAGVETYKANKEKISCIILDMIMPGMSGRKVFKVLKNFDPSVKVLLSSGYSIDGEAREILNEGCNGFIQKPYSIQKLADTLKEIIN